MAKSMLAAVQEAVFGKSADSTENELDHKPVVNSHSPLIGGAGEWGGGFLTCFRQPGNPDQRPYPGGVGG